MSLFTSTVQTKRAWLHSRENLSVITVIYLHLDESQTRTMSCGISISLARLAEGCAIWSISSEETTGPTHAENSQYSQSSCSSICAFQLILKNSQLKVNGSAVDRYWNWNWNWMEVQLIGNENWNVYYSLFILTTCMKPTIESHTIQF